ncbi:unnamed protein product [Arabis nemorensis]|uniref:NYN domain-containing protein n=1 Tax=Arabis nemorensis TaxID=586526 RepID=A0A565C711_9BRAS|nr:unnamed protein product [Arabis nemorensis]
MKSISVDLYAWRLLNHPDSVVMFVLGDVSRDLAFVNELADLRMSNFRVLLCQPSSARGLIFSPVTRAWYWDSLSLGGPPISDEARSQPLTWKNLLINMCFNQSLVMMSLKNHWLPKNHWSPKNTYLVRAERAVPDRAVTMILIPRSNHKYW